MERIIDSQQDKVKPRPVHGAHGVVVSHPLRMRKALGSIPSVSILPCPRIFVWAWLRPQIRSWPAQAAKLFPGSGGGAVEG